MNIISTAPHIRTRCTTKSIMRDMLIALLPAAAAGIVYFGWQAAVIIALALASAVLTELVWYVAEHKFRREGKTVFYSLDDDHVRSILSLGMEHVEE